jgi:hypothetical protein
MGRSTGGWFIQRMGISRERGLALHPELRRLEPSRPRVVTQRRQPERAAATPTQSDR